MEKNSAPNKSMYVINNITLFKLQIQYIKIKTSIVGRHINGKVYYSFLLQINDAKLTKINT